MNYKYKLFVSTMALVPLLISVEAQATIYKCVNVEAEVYYNDKPCPETDVERKLKAVKDPKGGYIPPKFVAEKEAKNLPGVVVGTGTERTVNKKNNDDSDNSSKGANSGGSNSAAQFQTQALNSKKSSGESSTVSRKPDSGNNTVSKSKSAAASRLKHLSKVTEIEPSS